MIASLSCSLNKCADEIVASYGLDVAIFICDKRHCVSIRCKQAHLLFRVGCPSLGQLTLDRSTHVIKLSKLGSG